MFGLDIGHASLKAMQIEPARPGVKSTVLGYGISDFPATAIQNGVIIKPEVVAGAVHELFEKNLVGSISSRRVACSLPTSHTFSRPMKLPPMNEHDIHEAIQLEAEQYIPIPIQSLYLDYEIISQNSQGVEILLVAAAKKIVDSYLSVLQSLQLEPVAFEPSISAVSRLLRMAGGADTEPSILIDIGSISTDISIFDRTLLVASTVNTGGDTMSELISKNLRISFDQATELKATLGIAFSEKQQRIVDAVKPQLETLVHEVQKSIRYHSERASESGRKISKVITVGGGAEMPGLNQYLSRELRLPTQNLDPWQSITFGKLPMPPESERTVYITATGEAVLNPAEIAV